MQKQRLSATGTMVRRWRMYRVLDASASGVDLILCLSWSQGTLLLTPAIHRGH